MTKSQIKELMENARAATPGPWFVRQGSPFTFGISDKKEEQYFLGSMWRNHQDAEFISAANPIAILDLCERLLGMQEALEFYATYIKRKYDEPNLRREFGCGCCSGFNNDEGDTELGMIQGLTARQSLEKFGVRDE